MIGVSLPFSWFWDDNCTQLYHFLDVLAADGVSSIELRTVRAQHTPEHVLSAVRLLWGKGLLCTIHGEVKSAESAVTDVFAPLALLLQEPFRQDSINITIHPIPGDNASMLKALSEHIEANQYPITITLENNRRLPDKSEGDSVAVVLQAVMDAGKSNVKMCLDMGHYAYYVKKFFPDEPNRLPPEEMWSYIGHTHIHGLDGLKTHFPLGSFELNLTEYLQKLSYKYFGVFNIELEFARFEDRFEPLDALRQSVAYLQAHMQHCSRIYDRTRQQLDSAVHSALSLWEGNKPSGVSLIHSTSYLFRTKDFFWGMDIAFRYGWQLCKTPAEFAKLAQNMHLMIITHQHADHFEPKILRRLAENGTQLLIPDFLKERVEKAGIPLHSCIFAQANVPVHIGPLTILPFPSRHFRPGTNRGVEEYGYYITAEGEPSLVFPGDIRDYSREDSVAIPTADYCFAHLWLGDDNRDWEDCQKRVQAFSEYMLTFSRKHLILTHLYENGRADHQMWRMEHALPVLDYWKDHAPETTVAVPDWGETIHFS